MTGLDLCYLPATRQLELFRSGALSPVEVLKAQIARADQVEGQVNAFTGTFFDRALKKAREAEAIYAIRPDDARPLEGLTLAVKEEMPVAGQSNTLGSLIYQGKIGEVTHPAVARLAEAGAIIHARTTVPEFCVHWATYSRLHGVTTNPWRKDITCGGSSGGSGAALAAGTATLATGSDIGGSIRSPAAACGVVGFKPPHGRVPSLPPFNIEGYLAYGPMARTTADCALMQNVMSGQHPDDIASLPCRMEIPLSYENVKGLRFAYTLDVGNEVVADDVKEHTLAALDILRDMGAVLEHVDLGWTRETAYAARDYMDFLLGADLVRDCEANPDLVCDYTRFLADRSKTVTRDRAVRAIEVAGEMYATLGPVLHRCHALICPAMITHEVRADQPVWERMEINGRSVDTDYEFTLLPQFNMLGRLPVLGVPTGIARSGLPMGVQVISRPFDDARVFRVAAALESAMPLYDCEARRPKFCLPVA